jgi:hypothetical protein
MGLATTELTALALKADVNIKSKYIGLLVQHTTTGLMRH